MLVKLIALYFAMILSILTGCAQFQKPVSLLDAEMKTTRDVQSFEVRRYDDHGQSVLVKAVPLETPSQVTVGPCQFEDGTTVARCVMWPSSAGRQQMELKPDWGVTYVTATKVEMVD